MARLVTTIIIDGSEADIAFFQEHAFVSIRLDAGYTSESAVHIDIHGDLQGSPLADPRHPVRCICGVSSQECPVHSERN